MKLFSLLSIIIFFTSFSYATQVLQTKKILTYFNTQKENEKIAQNTIKKDKTTKLIQLFDNVPEKMLPSYPNANLGKYYEKNKQKINTKLSEPNQTTNLPFSTPGERSLEQQKNQTKTITTAMPFSTPDMLPKVDLLSEEELDQINSETVTITTFANLFDDMKDDEVEQFPKEANYYDKITKMVKKAFSLIGSAYRFGASAGGNTYDCSLFTQTIFKKIGINIPRTAIEQSTIGKKIPKKDIVIGDLLFFATYRKSPSHVGIYIGDNKMIHASTKYGVTVSSLDMSYYQKRYLFAKRPNFANP